MYACSNFLYESYFSFFANISMCFEYVNYRIFYMLCIDWIRRNRINFIN